MTMFTNCRSNLGTYSWTIFPGYITQLFSDLGQISSPNWISLCSSIKEGVGLDNLVLSFYDPPVRSLYPLGIECIVLI